MKPKILSLQLIALFTLFSIIASAQDNKKQEEERMNQDWACLKCFQDTNTKVEPPKAGENRVIFMGNSITIGWSNLNPEFFAGKPYINRGISGQTTPQMLIRFRPDVINLKPKVVVIL